MQFDCTRERVGDVLVVTPFGDVDQDSAPDLLRALTAAIDEAGRNVVEVEMRHVAFLDSSGVGALLAANRLAGSSGATLRVRNPVPAVRMVLDITNVWQLLGS
jgi:anti-anti-sigma factor